jgi:integrase
MPRRKLTEKAIAKLRAPTASGKQVIYWDDTLRGFGVLLSGVSNSRTYVAQRDLPGGKTRRVTIAAVNEMALAGAKDVAADMLVDMRRGIDPKRRTAGTLQETLDAYLKANKDIKPRTRELYADLVRLHLAPWQDRRLASITPAEVDAMHGAIAAKVAKRGQHSGRSVANDAVCLFRLLYNFAARRDDDLPRNPVRLRGSEWHKVNPRRRPIDPEKLADFYAAVCKLPSIGRDYLLLLLFTGFRRREAAALRWDEIDSGLRIIRLPAARAKADRPLDLPMSDVVHSLLVARRQLGNATYVFPSYARSGHIQDARAWTDVVTATTGIEFCLHDLRRTFITVAESADISVMALKALVNHSLGAGVTESYIKMSAERLREPAQKVCDKLKALCGIVQPGGDKVTPLRSFAS